MDRIPTGPRATGLTETELTGQTPTEPTAPDRRRAALGGLLAPEAIQRFLDEDFGRQPYRGRCATATESLFGWERLNTALAEHRLAPPRLKLERDGADVTAGLFRTRQTRRGATLYDLDPSVLNERLRDGATLIVDAANELSPPLQALCERLSAAFLCACQANLYACWGSKPGFDVHWDDHDVFVVQVAGRKAWRLYGTTRPWPTRRDHHGEHLRPEAVQAEFMMGPGEVLYLPRGHWHAAVGVGEPSLHLTIGLTRKTGADFLHWLADEALQDPIVRADLPVEADDEALAARLETVIAWAAGQSPAELARLYRRQVEAGQAHRPKLSLPLIGAATDTLSADQRLRLAPGAARLWRAGEAVVLSWRGAEFTIAGVMEGTLRRLVAGDTVTVAAFQHLGSSSQVLAFLNEMIGRGVLVVDERMP
jgi:hypothetical protein